ncbi:MAG: hypothetical protein IPJ98_09020 [Bryobacterales bacterium]|nr:hypothetical protein [Bryobacterales bacterium]
MDQAMCGAGEPAAAQCCAQQCEDAISSLEAAFAEQPCNAELCHQIGICYSGACRRHSLVNLPMAAAYFERALALAEARGSRAVRAKYLDSLGNARRAGHRAAEALPVLAEALRIYRDLGLEEDWARTEYNLGNVCCELAGAGDSSQWEQAVQHYVNALHVRTERDDLVRFAATVQNLGTAYRELPSGDRRDNLRHAIGCYSAAFRACVALHLGGRCADLHNNLGNAFLHLPDSQEAPCKNVRRALRHYARALRFRSKDNRPHDYAVTQFNRGQGYLLLAFCESVPSLRRASQCFHEALDGFLSSGDDQNAQLVSRRLEALDRISLPAV